MLANVAPIERQRRFNQLRSKMTCLYRVILLAILGLDNDRFWRIKQDTRTIDVFDANDGNFTLVSLNDTCHLSD